MTKIVLRIWFLFSYFCFGFFWWSCNVHNAARTTVYHKKMKNATKNRQKWLFAENEFRQELGAKIRSIKFENREKKLDKNLRAIIWKCTNTLLYGPNFCSKFLPKFIFSKNSFLSVFGGVFHFLIFLWYTVVRAVLCTLHDHQKKPKQKYENKNQMRNTIFVMVRFPFLFFLLAKICRQKYGCANTLIKK